MIDAIHKEIKKLDLMKVDSRRSAAHGRTKNHSVSSTEIRCVARVCRYNGINSTNKLAVGLCSRCGNYEHFDCSKTKQEERDEILKGASKYFC